ncbi:hypothetical protein I302_101053 [Kwoniella bestiolae CBS 10118]|uniref:SDE2-like domain-containing protein n=1 Tax=Kwoniella bestiolae CBS 10118 TaxID=1296100 RepID=A0AAJ8K1C0_9TREE
MLQTIHLHLPAPLPFQSLNVHPETLVSDLPLPPTLLSNNTYLRTSTHILSPHTPISSLRHADSPNHPISINVCARLPGGKGGFGSQLRAAGGRMSTGKATNMDSCRDLSGRRLGTIKEAQRQADLLESAPALRAKLAAEEKSKLEALERKLGISTPDSFDDDAQGEGSSKRKVEDERCEQGHAAQEKEETHYYHSYRRYQREGQREALTNVA